MKTLIFAAFLMIAGLAHGQSINLERLSNICQETQQKQTSDSRIANLISLAKSENILMDGQQIDRGGGLVNIGFHESENEKNNNDSAYAWQHVAKYWDSILDGAPYSISIKDRKYERSEIFQQIKKLNAAASRENRIDDESLNALKSALLRTSLVDAPWSAAFISYLFKTSGYSKEEFMFSDGHIDYIDRAFQVSEDETQGRFESDYAYRACDISKTKPRVGDLICYARSDSKESNNFVSFHKLSYDRRLVVDKKPRIDSHCDVVIRSDRGGDSKLEAIGGNVFQSVTLRHMYLTNDKLINPNYMDSFSRKRCSNTENNCLGNINRKAWVVLLQRRN